MGNEPQNALLFYQFVANEVDTIDGLVRIINRMVYERFWGQVISFGALCARIERAELRERCARVCEDLRIPKLYPAEPGDYYAPNGRECASAIRRMDLSVTGDKS